MASYVPPRDPYELQVAAAAADALGRRDVGAFDDLVELGLSAPAAARVEGQLAAALGRRLPAEALLDARTVAGVAAACRAQPKVAPWSSRVTVRPAGDGLALAFVHPIGGNAFWYLDLCRKLGDDLGLYLLHARGLDVEEEPHRTIEQMAAAYAEELRAAAPAARWVLSGWSFGGLVAFETARRLAAAGAQAPLVALFDVGPQNQRIVPPSREAAWGLLIHALRLDRHALRLLALPERERVATTLELATSSRALPSDHAAAHVERMLELNLIHLEAAERFEPGGWDGDVLLFAATDRTGSDTADATDLGWGALVDGEVRVHPLPGTHFDALNRANLAEIAARLLAEIGRCGAVRPAATSSTVPAAPPPRGSARSGRA